MKYAVILGDGMADWKISALGGKTCLEAAKTPNFDNMVKRAETGLCKTVPDGLKPGSDVANMSVLGFDPEKFYTGRSPLEAVAMGINLGEKDVTLRCNFVTLSDEENFEDATMLDYSAGEITTREAVELINFLKPHIDCESLNLYAGIQYRHCLVVKNGNSDCELTPPHDISDKRIKNYLPTGVNSSIYRGLMQKCYNLLKEHPVNLNRIKQGKKPANSIWLWGEGTKPRLENFKTLRKLNGGIISAVDLIKGIGMLAGMKIIEVRGATGNYNTDFEAKAEAAANELINGLDFVYIHIEAADECGHHGDFAHKVYSVEKIDKVAGALCEKLKAANEEFAVLVCPDHPTPCEIKTHTSDAVPYMLYCSSKNLFNGATRYTEEQAAKTGAVVKKGSTLIEKLINL